jgi:hypothetical protein
MAAVHFTIGGISVMTAAETIVPAMNARGGRQDVEQVVYNRNVISQGFQEGGHAEHDQSRLRAEPGEAVVQMKMPSIGGPAHDQHRQKDAKTGRCGQGYAENDR